MEFIVNADDLGGSASINDAIFQALADGVISSATLMATGSAFDSAVRDIGRFPAASFGVHLNVTSGRPLSGHSGLQPLLDADGRYRPDGAWSVRWTRALRAAVVEEWTAQVAKVRDAGVRVSHLDSHHHVHTIPALFGPLKRVQRRFGLRRVRGTWSIYERSRLPSPVLRVKKRVWLQALRVVYATRTADEFADFLMFLRAVGEGSYRPRVWPRAIELMVHPNGNVTENGAEAAALRTGWMAALPCRAQLVPYHAL